MAIVFDLMVEASIAGGVAGIIEQHRGAGSRWATALNDEILGLVTKASTAEVQLGQASTLIG
jgi:hypothetical protein